MKRIFQSLRARLTFWVLLLSVVIFGSIAAVFHFYSYDREKKGAIRFTSARLESMAVNIKMKMQTVEFAVERAVPLVNSNLSHPENMGQLVEYWVRGDSLIMGGSIAFRPDYYPKEGKYFMEYASLDSLGNITHKRLGGSKYDYLNQEWFRSAVDQEKGVWSKPYYDDGGGQVAMITYALPLHDSRGEVFAVMTADVAVSKLASEISSLQTYADSRILMTDNDGDFITHWDEKQICTSNIEKYAKKVGSPDAQRVANYVKTGRSGVMDIEMKGRNSLAFFTTVPDIGWHICAFCTYKSIMGELLSTSLTIAGIFVVGLLLLSLCITLILRHEMRPLEYLAKAARQIGRGNFNVELPDIDGNDELRLMHDSFSAMQVSLADYIEELKGVTASKQRIESELHIAHALQMNMLPRVFPPFPDRKDIDLFASLTPAKEVGGDLYDFFIRDEQLFFTVGDVSGKGIPASLFMAITRSLFRIVAGSNNSPALIAKKLNDAVADENDTNMFITMFIGVVDLKSGMMTFCNAGHNPPIVMPVKGNCEYMDVLPNLPIGIMQGFDYEEQSIDINDTGLLVYTDGVTEAESPSHSLFGEDNLINICDSLNGESSIKIIKGIADEVKRHADTAEQSDDITILHVRLKGDKQEEPADNGKINGDGLTRTLAIKNNLAELSQLPEFLETIAAANGIDEIMITSLNLAIEEAMVNVINYAYPEGMEGDVVLTATCKGNTLSFTLEDNGKPFDPTRVPDADTSLSADERPIGGLGIFLVRQLMDTMTYEYKDGKNILTMTKTLS